MKHLVILVFLATVFCLISFSGVAKEATPDVVATPEISATSIETNSVISTGAPFQAGADTGGAVGTLNYDCLDQDVFCGARCTIACWPGSFCICFCTYTGNPQDVCLFSQCSCS